MMKKLFALAFCVLLGSQAFAQSTLPSTPVRSFHGASVPFNSIVKPGEITLISFWATWCVPCKKEIKSIREHLKSWHKAVKFNYVTVSIDDSRATAMARSYARSQGWDFPSYLDPNQDLKRSLNFQNIPFSMIVDQNGKIAYRHTGYAEGGEMDLFEKIKELSQQKQ